MWPLRVEFVDGGFEPGVLNVYHGPFLNVAGVVGQVKYPRPGVPAYRDLKYFYGSYAISQLSYSRPGPNYWAEETALTGRGTLFFAARQPPRATPFRYSLGGLSVGILVQVTRLDEERVVTVGSAV